MTQPGNIIRLNNLSLSHILKSPRFLQEFPILRQYQQKLGEHLKKKGNCRCRNRQNQIVSAVMHELKQAIENFSDEDKQRFKKMLGAATIVLERVQNGKPTTIEF